MFWTEVGEAPERIKVSRIALGANWSAWHDEPALEVMRPERAWEGVQAPLLRSVRGTAYGCVNQLRDPAVFEEDGATYLLYAGGGGDRDRAREGGIQLRRTLTNDIR